MKLTYKRASPAEIETAFMMFGKAAENLAEKKVEQWQYWLNPPIEKITWVQDGFKNNEFYFIYTDDSTLVGMYRLMHEDLLYWGKQEIKARYIHSLVVLKEFSGKNIGGTIIKKIEQEMRIEHIPILRLDCDASNDRLCQYYIDLGFKKVGEKQMPLSLNNLYEKTL